MEPVWVVPLLIFALPSPTALASSHTNFNVSVNGIVDYNLNFFNLLFNNKELTKIELSTVIIDDETRAQGVSIEDMSTMIRVGETRLWESENNTLNFIASMGLETLKITIDNLTNAEQSFIDKECFVSKNELTIHVSINFWDWGCFIDLVELKVIEFEVGRGEDEDEEEDESESNEESEPIEEGVKEACEALKDKANLFFAGPNLRKLIFNYSPCSNNPGALMDFMTAVRMI